MPGWMDTAADVVGAASGRQSSVRNANRRRDAVASVVAPEVDDLFDGLDLPGDLAARVQLGDRDAVMEAVQHVLQQGNRRRQVLPLEEMPTNSELRQAADRTLRAYAGDQFVNTFDANRSRPDMGYLMVAAASRSPGLDVMRSRMERLGSDIRPIDQVATDRFPMTPDRTDALLRRIGAAGAAAGATYGANQLGRMMFLEPSQR